MTYPTYNNLIGGQWVAAASGETILNLNPADHSDVIGAFPSSHAEDVALAVAAAKKAFATWRLVPAPKRAEILFRAPAILVQNKEKYAREMTREMGKVLAETRGDVQEAIDEAFYVAGEGRRLFGVTTPSELPDKFAMSRAHAGRRRRPDHAMELPHGHPQLEALSRRSSPATPVLSSPRKIRRSPPTTLCSPRRGGTSSRCRQYCLRPRPRRRRCAGGASAMSAPSASPAPVKLVRWSRSAPPRTFKQVSLEMGGKNAQIVLDDANLDLALDGALWGAFGTTGQRCTATSRILLQKGIAAEFTERFVARAKRLKVGNGLDESVEVGPQVNAAQIETSQKYVEIAQREGAQAPMRRPRAHQRSVRQRHIL